MKHFSIIIPIYNSQFLEIQLKTLQMQTYPKDMFEVVYSDDGSDDAFVEKYKKIFSKFPGLSIRYDYF